MSSRAGGLLAVLLGALLAVVSVMADVIGIGNDPTRFAAQQLAGTLAGVALILTGIVVYVRAR